VKPITLPHPPTDAMHILPPALPLLISLALAALALYLLYRLRRFLRKRSRKVQKLPTPSKRRTTGDAFGALVGRIEAEYVRSEDYRGGLHALAAAVRTRLEEITGIRALPETVEELAPQLEDAEVEALLVDLRDQRFGRKEPGRTHFRKLCRQTRGAFPR